MRLFSRTVDKKTLKFIGVGVECVILFVVLVLTELQLQLIQNSDPSRVKF